MGALTEQLEGSEALGTSTPLHHRIKKKKPNGAVEGRCCEELCPLWSKSSDTPTPTAKGKACKLH